MAEKKRGCTGWAAVMVFTVVLAFAGGGLLFTGLEVLALAFTRVGVTAPDLAWGLTGGVLGTLLGAVVGLRRAGRKHQLPEVALSFALVGGLAFLGADAASDYVRPSPGPPTVTAAPPSQVLFEVVVTADELNVRPAPAATSDPFTTVVRGERLGVVGEAPGWYAVRFAQHGRVNEGWVSSAYATRVGDAPGEGTGPGGAGTPAE